MRFLTTARSLIPISHFCYSLASFSRWPFSSRSFRTPDLWLDGGSSQGILGSDCFVGYRRISCGIPPVDLGVFYTPQIQIAQKGLPVALIQRDAIEQDAQPDNVILLRTSRGRRPRYPASPATIGSAHRVRTEESLPYKLRGQAGNTPKTLTAPGTSWKRSATEFRPGEVSDSVDPVTTT